MAIIGIFCILFVASANASFWSASGNSTYEERTCPLAANCCKQAVVIKATGGKGNKTFVLTWKRDMDRVVLMEARENLTETSIFVEQSLPNSQHFFQTPDLKKYVGVNKEGQLRLKEKSDTRFLLYRRKFPRNYYVFLALRRLNELNETSEQCFLLRPNRSSIKLMNPKFCSSSSDFYQNIFKNKVCFAMESIVNNPINWFQKERVVKKQKRKCGVFTRCSSHVDPALLNCCPCDSCTPPTRRKFH
eukprot:m.161293 g.161293  ORF g.161293 m.161293 type:complete len:246 (+) comp38813_c1_seq12:1224-1961(+)